MPDWRAARDWLCNPEAEVSAHYILSEQGDVVQLVDEDQRAWHAGAGAWGDISDVNSRSIGIEMNNIGDAPFAAPLMDALEGLLADIMARWAIPPERVIAHSDLAPWRKIDPGVRFDWARLARCGLAVKAHATHPSSVDSARFEADLTRIGYAAPAEAQTLLSAFRLRHRQGHTGPLGGWDCALGKSGLHQGTVPGNARAEQSDGERHREQTASVRAWQAPPGAMPNRDRAWGTTGLS